MQAIITKYLPPTNTKPSRIKAECERGSIIISYDSELGDEGANRKAVEALVARFVKEDAAKYGSKPESNPWARPFVTGGTKSFYCHVFVK